MNICRFEFKIFIIERTNCMFSPNDKYIVTGTSTKSDTDSGRLVVLDRDSLEIVHEIEISDSVSRILKIVWLFLR